MTYLNGETIRELVAKLPPVVFDNMIWDFPDLLEMETWKCEYIHWCSYDEFDDYAAVCDWFDVDPEDPEIYIQQYDDGCLVIE